MPEKEGKPYESSALYYAESDDRGKTFKPHVKLFDNSCECCRVAMVLDIDSVPVIFWRHVFTSNIRDHAMVKLDSKSQLTWNNAKVASSSIGPSDHPLLITYKNKSFLSWYTTIESYRLIPIQ